jgi:predicted transcriptional regulator
MTKREQYLKLREQGLSYAKIAKLCGIDPSMVWKAINKEIPPRRQKDPSKIQVKTRKTEVFAPIKCKVCRNPIVIGEQYVNDTGHETHVKCLCSA